MHAEPSPQSQHPANFSDHKSHENEDIDFSNFHVATYWSKNQRVMWLKWWDPLMVSQHLAYNNGHNILRPLMFD